MLNPVRKRVLDLGLVARQQQHQPVQRLFNNNNIINCRQSAATATCGRTFATDASAGSSLGGLNDEQQAIQDLARSFSREEIVPRAAEYDRSMAVSCLSLSHTRADTRHTHTHADENCLTLAILSFPSQFPWEIVKKGHETGLMNLHVPEDVSSVKSSRHTSRDRR